MQIKSSSDEVWKIFGLSPFDVATRDILGVPAVFAAQNFIAGMIAGLPLHVYQRKADGTKERVAATGANPIVGVLHDAVNDELTSFQWRYDMFASGVLHLAGRSVTYIERDASNRVINLFPIQSPVVQIDEIGRKTYVTKAAGKEKTYAAADVIDIVFRHDEDRVTAVSPITRCKIALGKAAAVNEYGARLFRNGGMPSFALQGPFEGKASAERAQKDVGEAAKKAAQEGGTVLALPIGHELKDLGLDPEKMQMVEVQRFLVEEVARIFSLPPVFLQDLTHGTFSNTEQQDLHLVKHSLKRWVEQIEQELNLKLFGRNAKRFVEFNMDGLMRGDFKTRMEGMARAVQSGLMTPDEGRALDNRPPMDGGDKLYIQGATVPLTDAGTVTATQTQGAKTNEP